MKLWKAFALAAAVGLASVAYAQAPAPASSAPARMDTKWVSAIVGVNVETPAGAGWAATPVSAGELTPASQPNTPSKERN